MSLTACTSTKLLRDTPLPTNCGIWQRREALLGYLREKDPFAHSCSKLHRIEAPSLMTSAQVTLSVVSPLLAVHSLCSPARSSKAFCTVMQCDLLIRSYSTCEVLSSTSNSLPVVAPSLFPSSLTHSHQRDAPLLHSSPASVYIPKCECQYRECLGIAQEPSCSYMDVQLHVHFLTSSVRRIMSSVCILPSFYRANLKLCQYITSVIS